MLAVTLEELISPRSSSKFSIQNHPRIGNHDNCSYSSPIISPTCDEGIVRLEEPIIENHELLFVPLHLPIG
jgi:hypothetical protein